MTPIAKFRLKSLDLSENRQSSLFPSCRFCLPIHNICHMSSQLMICRKVAGIDGIWNYEIWGFSIISNFVFSCEGTTDINLGLSISSSAAHIFIDRVTCRVGFARISEEWFDISGYKTFGCWHRLTTSYCIKLFRMPSHFSSFKVVDPPQKGTMWTTSHQYPVEIKSCMLYVFQTPAPDSNWIWRRILVEFPFYERGVMWLAAIRGGISVQ